MMQEKVPKDLKLQSLVSQLDDDAQNGFKVGQIIRFKMEKNNAVPLCISGICTFSILHNS